MFDAIDNDSSIDGVVCRKRYFDQHEGAEEYREDIATVGRSGCRLRAAEIRAERIGPLRTLHA
jgi:hypothetical protein